MVKLDCVNQTSEGFINNGQSCVILSIIVQIEQSFSKSGKNEPNSYCNYTFPIDMAPSGFWFYLTRFRNGILCVYAYEFSIFYMNLQNLEHLIRMPYGCGEQNMVGFAPNIFVMKYLDATNLNNNETADKLRTHMRSGRLCGYC